MWSIVLAAALCQPQACNSGVCHPMRTVVKAPVVAVVKVVEARPVRKAVKVAAKATRRTVGFVLTPRRTCRD